jgi:hypothetical protein
LTSRYDTTTGDFIPVPDRIGLIDRKLRVLSENIDDSGKWLELAQTAYKSTYGFEWQGDNLLLAREAMLVTFIENYKHKFDKEPLLKSIQYIAYIVSWNLWQMDGLKGVIPNTCTTKEETTDDLFGAGQTLAIPCQGCKTGTIHKHNGIYALIKDWSAKDPITGTKGHKIRFVDLIKK